MSRRKGTAGNLTSESREHLVNRMHEEYAQLVALYPHAGTTLDHFSAWQLLVATVLSAQTTDRRVNTVTPELFSEFPTPQALANADIREVERIIRPIGFFHMKAMHIIELSDQLIRRFHGVVPQTREELVTLPGVGRKTANVVLGDAFHKPGFPVDTHVKRVTSRLRWHDQWKKTNPDVVKIEKEVCACFPPDEWANLSHRLIYLGRNICHARSPRCSVCPLRHTCPSASLSL
jgi:endonuclease-3